MNIMILAISAFCLMFSACTVQAHNPENFRVHSATDDSAFELSEHKGTPVVLHFLLKTECPICMRYTHDYAALAEKNSGVVHVFLKPDSEDDIKAWTKGLDKRGLAELPTIYRDVDAKIADEYKIPNGYEFHGQTVHYPALIILDGEGKERFRYVGKSNSDRLSVKDFETQLAKLKNETRK